MKSITPSRIAVLILFTTFAALRADTFFVNNSYPSRGVTGTVERIASDGTRSLFADPSDGLNVPTGMAFDSAGLLYVASQSSNTILRFTPGGVPSVFADMGKEWSTSLAFDNAGNLFVGNTCYNVIEKVTPAGVRSVFANLAARPTAMAFDGSGNLFVATELLGALMKFTPGGVGTILDTNLGQPGGLVFDSAGNLFLADSAADVIYKYTVDGTRTRFVGTYEDPVTEEDVEDLFLHRPIGLAFDSSGDLYAVNYEGVGVTKITPDGVESTFAITSGGSRYIAIRSDAVPEPSALVLFAGGMLGITFQRKRRA